MGVREHFWELRKEIKANNFKGKKLKERNFLEKIWVPFEKMEKNVFLSSEECFELKEIWEVFKKYKEYKKRRDEFSFLFREIEGEIEKIIEEETSFKEIKPDVSGAELVKKVLEEIKKGIKRKKGEIIRRYYYGCDSIKNKRLFLFISIKKTGLEEIEVSYFVGDTKIQRFKSNSRMFHRVPEGAMEYKLIQDQKGKVIPQYIFEF